LAPSVGRRKFAADLVQLAAGRSTVTVWIGINPPGKMPNSVLGGGLDGSFVLSVEPTQVARTGPPGEFVHCLG
jgi:hypothetical protein